MQQVVEVPLPMRAIAIKEVHAEVTDIKTHIMTDKVIVQGIVRKQVFFVGEDNIVHHFPESMRFSAMISLPGVAPGMTVQVTPKITNIVTELVRGGDAILQKVIIDVFATALDLRQFRVAQDPYGTLILARSVVGERTVQQLESQDIALPSPAIKVSEIRVTPTNLVPSVRSGQVVVTGDLEKQIFYVGPDDATRHVTATVPFSVMAEIPGTLPGMEVYLLPTIRDVAATLSPDGGTVSEEVLFDIFIKVLERSSLSVATGEGPTMLVDHVLGQGTSQIGEESQVTLSRPASKIIDITATVASLRARVVQDKVILQGMLSKDVTYVGEDGLTYTESFNVPFNDFVEVPGAIPSASVFATAEVAGVAFDPATTGQLVTEEAVIDIYATVVEEMRSSIVLDPVGVLIQVPVIVAEGMAQVMAEIIIERVGPVSIEYDILVFDELSFVSRQILAESLIPLGVPAIKIKSADARVLLIEGNTLNGKILVEGRVHVDVQFVGDDNIVRSIGHDIPFSAIEELPEAMQGTPVEVSAEIEGVVAKLTGDRLSVHVLVILRILIGRTVRTTQQVVTKVQGEGVTSSTTRIRAMVLRDGGAVPAELDVVTECDGPRVSEVARRTVNVEIVGGPPGPVPLSVVTDVKFAW
ncbi:MAG TPA: DUF3794 domain-containing protein [Firmicutes bacterium]|nr:DUF3794 domain-containing protein [Bacillota bacterium]